MTKEKNKTLTTRFDSETWAEFSAAVEILGFRSINSLVHQLVMTKIREAKAAVDAEEFEKTVARQKKQTEKRSKMKSKERFEMIGEIMPKSKTSIPVLKQPENTQKKKAG